MRSETKVKVEGAGFCDKCVAVLGEDQYADIDGSQIVEEMMCVVLVIGRGDGWAQSAVIGGDDGDQAPVALPDSADGHGRNSSRAV